jgi:acyl-CoA synthetase (AMP-forming)/AMP-acid ligase II
VTANVDSNFAAQLVKRLGPQSFLIDAAIGRTISPQDLSRLIPAYGASLLSSGLQKGDRVLIGCTLSLTSALVYLGAMYAGLVAVPVEDRAVRASGTTLLEATGAKAVWTEAGLRGRSFGRNFIRLEGEFFSKTGETLPPAACEISDVTALMATSGSTREPRFVMVTHGNLIANTEAIVRSQQLTSDDRAMLVLPLSYCFGASVLHSHLYQGGAVVLDRRFMFPSKVLTAVAQYGCTTFAGVPTVYNVLLRRSNIRGIAIPSLRRFLQAGGNLPSQRVLEMQAVFPTVKFYVMYGQTEATARISCMDPDRWEEKQGSVGVPLDNLEVRIIDENGADLQAGKIGELLVKGPSVCAGYLNAPEETRRVYSDGWLRTGDLARRDEDGYLWIEGRKASFLKVRGMRVSLSDVEATVMAIPGIYECAARAVDHPEAGEAIVLFIVRDQETKTSEEDVRRHLPAHWPIDSIHAVPSLPKTSTGKIALSPLSI